MTAVANTNKTSQYALALIVCILAHAAITLTYAITLHYELKTSGFDGTVYEQMMRNFIDGKGFTTSINPPYIPQHWLGFHFSPILYLLIPLYWLLPYSETLLGVGSFFVALAAWPIFTIALHLLRDTFQAFVIALLYLVSPFVVNGVVWGFHEIDFAPLCIALMLGAVIHKKPITLLLLGVVLMSIKEHYGLSVAGFGLLWAWHWKQPKFGLGLAAFGIAALCLILMVVIPYFSPTGAPSMMNTASPQDRFSWITSLDGISAKAWPTLVSGLWYALMLLLPFMFLPLASFAWLLPAVGDVAVNVMSQEAMMRSVFSYHSIPIFPILLVATCISIKKIFNDKRWRWKKYTSNDMMLPITVAVAVFAFHQTALPFSEFGNVWELSKPRFTYADNDLYALSGINAIIPKDAPVSAQMNVLPHLRVRETMISYPLDKHNPKIVYVVLKLQFPFESALSVMGLPYGVSSGSYFSNVEELLQSDEWGVIFYADRWVVLKRNTPDDTAAHAGAADALEKLKNEYQLVRDKFRRPSPKQPAS